MGILDSKQTTSGAPWQPAQPYIKKGMAQAGKLLARGQGFHAPKFPTYTPMSAQTQAGLGSMWDQAQGGNPLAAQSEGAVSGILGGATNDKYNQLYNDSSNQAFAQNVQNQSDLIANDVQRQFSGLGRTGSAADTGALVSQLGDYRTKAMADNWNQNIANQRGILGDQTQGQLGAVAAAPGAYQQRFLPAQYQQQVGAAYDDLATRKLQSQVDRFNTNQQAPWNRLNAYNGAINGTGGSNPGFGSQTVTTPFNPFGTAAGLALGAASVYKTATGGGGLSKL